MLGIGGGVFIFYWDNKNKVFYIFDGCEIVLKVVNFYWFIEGNKLMCWLDVVVGGKLVGVFGVVKVLEMV